MTPIRKALALGAVASVLGLVSTQSALAQLGRAKTTPTPTPSIYSLLTTGSTTTSPAATTFTPATVGAQPLGRPPISQPIPGPILN